MALDSNFKLMKKNNCKSTVLLMFLLLMATVNAQKPIVQTKFTADPAPMVYNDTVYLYTTHDEDDAPPGMAGFRMKEWLLYSSTDMVNWTDHGIIASLESFAWVNIENGAWAHECIERNGKFYLYVTIHGRGIGVLVSESPYGPFVDALGKPLVFEGWQDIDPTVLIDDDGQAYMYWGNPDLYYIKLNEDMISVSGKVIKDESKPAIYQEGPWVYKRNGIYYNAFASTCCPEGIGYAMSDKPFGAWEGKGYIMKPDGRSSGNHPGIIDYKGKWYVFGFNYKLNFAITNQHHERRSICVAEMKYNSDGTIQELPWWDEGVAVKQIGTLNPYKRTEAETISWSEGLKTNKSDKTGMYITSVHNGDYIKVQGVDFKKGAKSFEASAASIKGGQIEIRLDSNDGTLLGICEIKSTGGMDTWKVFTTKTKKAEGVHDLYFVFKGIGQDELFNLDYWKFK